MPFLQKNEYREYFMERFGISREILEKYIFLERGRKIWAFSGKYLEIGDIELIGIKALTKGRVLKPSTAFLRIVGKRASKNVIRLNYEEMLLFMKGEDIEKSFPVEPGYVIVVWEEDVLGCGFYKNGVLKSQIPSKYRMQDSWI